MTAVHPHRLTNAVRADITGAIDAAKVTVYWFDEERRLRRDDERRRRELPRGVRQLFGDDVGTSVHPIRDDSGQVVGIATRMS